MSARSFLLILTLTYRLKAISRLSYLLAHGNGRGAAAGEIEAKKQLSKIQKGFPV